MVQTSHMTASNRNRTENTGCPQDPVDTTHTLNHIFKHKNIPLNNDCIVKSEVMVQHILSRRLHKLAVLKTLTV